MLGLLGPSTGDVATGPDEGPAGCGASDEEVPGTEEVPVAEEEVPVAEEEVPVAEEAVPVVEEEVPVTAGIMLDFCRFPSKVTSDAIIGKAKALRKEEWYL